MFAFVFKKDIIFNTILITVLLISALLPSQAYAQPSQQGSEPTGTPTQTATSTPTETSIAALTITQTPSPTSTQETETSTPAVTSIATPTSSITPTPSRTDDVAPTLELSADVAYITSDGAFILYWEILGVTREGQRYVLQVNIPSNLLLEGRYEGEFDESTHILTVPVIQLNGQIQLNNTGETSDAYFEAALFSAGEPVAKARLFLPFKEEFILERGGGEIQALEGRVRINFPQNALLERATIRVGKPTDDEMPSHTLTGNTFELTAHGAQSRQDITQFSEKLSIFYSYADLGVPEELEGDLHIYWYDPERDVWLALPTMVNTQTKTLQAFTDHFTVFDINVESWQASRLPTIDSFQVSAFTGAATYSYPIELPPGPGGFQPSLTLSYNSQVVDQTTLKSQASWVGMGWSLDTGYIEANTMGTSTWTGDDTHYLNVGGVSTQIVQDGSGVYHAADENFWKISYDATEKIWTVKDKTGNTYEFAHKSSYPYQIGSCETQDASVGWITYRWSLSRVTNIFGQEIKYTYVDQLNPLEMYQYSGGQCNLVDPNLNSVAATYPETITYANGRYRVRFDRFGETLNPQDTYEDFVDVDPNGVPFRNRRDYPDEWQDLAHPDNNNSFHVFERFRLINIFIEQDADETPDGNFETIIRQYKFNYAAGTDTTTLTTPDSDIIFPGYTWSALGKTSTLRSVQQYGEGGSIGGAPLPATTFFYNEDVNENEIDNLHLQLAENGYGGSVEFDYEEKPWFYPNRARDSYTTVVNFGFAGQACYGGVTTVPWHPRTIDDTVTCGSGQNPPLSVSGTAYATNIQNVQSSSWGTQRSLDLIRPGGVYDLRASINTQDNAMQVGLYDGTGDEWSEQISGTDYYVHLPADATTIQPLVKATGGSNPALISYFELGLLTSVYRVETKWVSDGSNKYQYTYSYTDSNNDDTARVNDRTLSPNSTCDPATPTCYAYSETYSEFRGNGQVTEIGPDGTTTITKFHQDDILKGRPISTTVSAGGTNISKVEYAYTSVPLWIKTYKACGSCPTYLGVTRDWTYTDYETKTIFDINSVAVAQTRVDYTYESTYGNLITQADQYVDGSNWATYRSTTHYYWPNATNNKYLVSLPGKTKVFDGAGGTLGTTLYLYDGNTGDHQTMPENGHLTAVRTLAQNGGDYSQITYTYDNWGNRNSVTTYAGYALWNANPSTTPQTTTTEYDTVFHVYPISQTTSPTLNAPQGLSTYWEYDYDGDGNDDYILGVPTSETDPNGAKTEAAYDRFGRLTHLYRPDPGSGVAETTASLTVSHQDSVPFTTTITQKVNETESYMVQRIYDGMGRQTKIISGPPSSLAEQTVLDTIYDSAGTITKQRVPYFANETPPNIYTTTTIYPATRTTIVTASDGTSTVTTNDGLVSTFKDANLNTTTTAADIWGRTYSIEPYEGPSLTYTYDELDRLREVHRTGSSTNTGPGTTGLISWWSMNEMSGTRKDSHGTNNLTDNNTVGYSTGLQSNAAKIVPASLERLTRNDNASLSTGNIDFTLVANVYLNSTSSTMVIANKGDKNNQNVRDYTLYYAGGAFGLRVGNGSTTSAVTSTGTITAGQWYTIVAWHDSVNDSLNIQVNNGAVNTVSYAGGAMDTTFPLSIGAHSDGTYGLDGRIDEVALYKRVLTAAERGWFYNSGLGRNYADLTATGSTVTSITTLNYDSAGRKTSMIDPDMGDWYYDYDALGNLTKQTDANGQTICLYYDSLNRLTEKYYPTNNDCTNPTFDVTYSYDSGVNGIGRRTGMSDSSGSSTWTFDSRGRMLSETKTITGAGTFKTSWTYNIADMPITMTYPGGPGGQPGEVVTYGYDSRMLLKTVIGDSSYVTSTTYDSAGRIDLRTFGNSTQTDYVYYPWNTQGGRLHYLKFGTASSPASFQDLGYTYDANGNITEIQNSTVGISETQSFTYDTLSRLTSATVTNGPAPYNTETYGYNPATGSLEIKAGIKLGFDDAAHVNAVTSTDNGTPSITSDDNYFYYDANGNQIKSIVDGQTQALEFNAENRLTKVCEDTSGNSICDTGETVLAVFVYDADGRRVKATVDNESIFFVGGHYEFNSTTGEITKYYFAGGSRIAMRSYIVPQNDTLIYLFGDHLGSTSITTDDTGALLVETRYKAWGEVRYTTSNSTLPTRYTFTGQYSYMDDEATDLGSAGIRLMFYNARFYSPYINHFIQPDTIIPNPANPQSWNRYSYVKNNPINFSDPTGHFECDLESSCMGGGGASNPTPPITPSNIDGSNNPQTDITEWLVEELNNQLGGNSLANPMGYCAIGGYECSFTEIGGLYGSHLTLFGNRGKYDIKRKMEGIYYGAVVLCGESGCQWVDYSAPGNVMYGYLSAARGVEQGVSWIAAGLLEYKDWLTEGRKNGDLYTGELGSWGDNPGDKAAVDFGYSLYENYPDGLSLSEFQSALTMEILDSFQEPIYIPVLTPLPQSNMYPPGYFLNP